MKLNPITIRIEMAKRQYSGARLAQVAGVSRQTLSAILHGRKLISPYHVAKIAEVLGVSVDTFFCPKAQQSPIPEEQGSERR